MSLKINKNFEYKRIYGTISGYTTTYNCIENNFPFVESIKSFLPICDEVVVVDGCSKDGTFEELEKLQEKFPQIMVYQNEFDWTEPGSDGLQKSFSRALCENDFLLQFDVDEFAHENDVEKWKMITKRFPKNFDILHLPVVELWGDEKHVTSRRHAWKWRLSRNKPEITHGINVNARLTDEKTGKVYAKKGMSDGCEYINCMNNQMLPHTGFYNTQFEMARLHMSEDYAKIMNEIFKKLPSVYHASWLDIPRKVQQLKPNGVWDKMWSLLYQEKTQNRFPDINFENEKEVKQLVDKLIKQGGEDSDQVKHKFKLEIEPPNLLKEWTKNRVE